MYFNKYLKKENFWWRFIPIILLAWGIFYMLCFSPIPIADGFGWDGVTYGKIAMHFEDLINSNSLNQYYTGRIFPSVLIHYALKIFNIPLNPKTVLIAFQVYNIIVLFSSGIIFNLIAKELKWDVKKIAIGFIALFVSYPILNFHQYYPVLTDSSVFLLSMIMLYAYLKNNSVLLLIVSIIGFFTWSTEFIIGAVLYIFSKSNTKAFPMYYGNRSFKIQNIVIFIITISPLLAYLVYFNIQNFYPILGPIKNLLLALHLDQYIALNYSNIQNFSDRFITSSSLNLIVATLINLIFYWVFLNIFIDKINLKKLANTLLQKPIVTSFSIVLVIFILLSWLKYNISYIDNNLSIVALFKNLSKYSVKFAGQFIVSNISYFGPFLIFILFYLKGYLYYVSRTNIMLSILFVILIVFSINTESRVVINLYPFFVLFFINWFDFGQIKKFNLFALFLLITSILYSKIWFPIKLPHSSFPNSIWDNLDQFPMQYYFMNHGPWQNKEMYLLHLFIGILVSLAMLYFLPTAKQNRILAYFPFTRVKTK